MVRSCILTALGLVAYTLAIDVSGFVQWNEHCRDYSALGHAKVILDDGFASGSITKDGRWSIPDVEPGTYILSVLAHDHKFETLRLDVLPDPALDPEARPLLPGTPLNPPSPVLLPYPIKLSARLSNSYYVPPESFNILAMVGNPMTLMMLFGGVMVFAVPYLTKNLDPEMAAEMDANQAKIASIQNTFLSGDIAGGMSAIMNAEPPAPPAGPSVVTTATQNTSKKSAKKRR